MRCFECDDYLCETCVNSHTRNRHQKQHFLLTLEELLSNKALQTLPDYNICSKHKGELLMFFCETCDVPICSKCAVVAHIHPEHKRVELDEITTDERKERMKKLENETDQVVSKIDELISQTGELERKTKASSAPVLSELDDIKESLKSQFLENLEKRYQESKDEIQYSENQIKKKTAELKNYRNRLATTKKIAEELVAKGSEFEIASVYSNIMKSLTEFCKVDTNLASSLNAEIQVYFADDKIVHDSSVAKLCTIFRDKTKKYDMKEINQFGQLQNGRGISFANNQTVVVSNHDPTQYFSYVYNYGAGNQVSVINNSSGLDSGWISYPWCIVYSSRSGQYFGTDGTQYVKYYNGQQYGGRLNVYSPSGTYAHSENSKVQGLALDKDGNLIVGNTTKKYISIVYTNGTRISSINVSIEPWFISTTPTNNIIVSSYNDHAVQVVDRNGGKSCTLCPPHGIPTEYWNPTGVCCSKQGTLFVANYRGRTGIFQYSLKDGKYIYVGCCTSDVVQPWGIALSDDETKLAVADNKCVKIFELK